jgi:hypothetical protein
MRQCYTKNGKPGTREPIFAFTETRASGLSQSRSVAALAFHHLVALLDQALAFAILALGFLLDVRAFFIGHDGLPGEFKVKVRPLDCDRSTRVERL